MLCHKDHIDQMSVKYRRVILNALLSLALGALAIILLLSTLDRASIVSASQGENTVDGSIRETLCSQSGLTTFTLQVTQTVDPPHPDTGGVVTICFTVRRPSITRIDIILAQDVSGSMMDPAGETPQTRLAASRMAVGAFVNSLQNTDRAAVVPFSGTALLAQPLTNTKNAIIETIYSFTSTGRTNIGEAIRIGHQELITSTRYSVMGHFL